MQIIICDDKSFTYLNNDSMVKRCGVKGERKWTVQIFTLSL